MGSQNIQCVCDTYIDNNNEERYKTHNNDVSMSVRGTSVASGNRKGIVQFHIPDFINKQVVSAKLHLFNISSNSTNTIMANLYTISADMSGLTYGIFTGNYASSKEADSDSTYTSPGSAPFYETWIQIDISTIIKNNLGRQYLTLVIESKDNSASGASSFGTKENGTAPYIQVDYTESVPDAPLVIYPNGEVIEKTGTLQFRWKYKTVYDSGQRKFDLEWRMQGNVAWTIISQISQIESYTMDMSPFSNGIVEWRIRTYNANNLSSPYSYGKFEVTGKPDAPVIISVKNSAITEIRWNCKAIENCAFEINIIKDSVIIYKSGMQPGMEVNSFIPNIMLSNGSYIFQIRIKNNYGIWSELSSKAFTINCSTPLAPDIYVSSARYGIELQTGANGIKYIYRSENGIDYAPIAKISGNTYTDCFICSNRTYWYFIRALANGYADSQIKTCKMSFPGYLISEINDNKVAFGAYLSTEDFHIKYDIIKNNHFQLVNYLGRTYPIKESGIFKEDKINLQFFLENKEWATFDDMFLRDSIYIFRNDEVCICCVIDNYSYSNAFFNKGKQISLSLTRLDYIYEVKFDE